MLFYRIIYVYSEVRLTLDFNTLCPIHIVAFTVCGKILGVCWRGWLKILGILCQLQSFCFLP